MKTRTLELDLQTAKEWFNGNVQELKDLALKTFPELAKKQLPKTWEELGEIIGSWVDHDRIVNTAKCSTLQFNKNIFATKEQAEASIALAQLSQLREVYRDGWKPVWSDDDKYLKYCIIFDQNKIIINTYSCLSRFLSFQDRETAKLFLENFRDLIEQAKPLMS